MKFNRFSKLLRLKQGQATTEYLLLLAVAVFAFLTFQKMFGPMMTRLYGNATAGISTQFAQGINRFPLQH
jgi:hypothetical protein